MVKRFGASGLSASVIRAYETGVDRRTIATRIPPRLILNSRAGRRFLAARKIQRAFSRNRRFNKASSTISKAFKRFQWRSRRAPTPFGPYSWTAKTARYGTKARAAQNKWRRNRFPM